jgi:hypothetical protein
LGKKRHEIVRANLLSGKGIPAKTGEEMSVQKLKHHVIGKYEVFLPSNNRAAWVTNADNDEIRSPIVVPAEWSSIFSKNSNPFTQHLSIFVGPKGVGKSTLLHLKRALVEGWVAGFDAANNVVCLPAQDGMLSFKSTLGQSIRLEAGTHEWTIFSGQEAWTALWRILLATWVLQADFDRRVRASATFKLGEGQSHHRNVDQKGEDGGGLPQLPGKVLQLFDRAGQRIEPTDVVRCLNAAVRKKMSANDMTALYETELLPLLRKYIGTVRYCMFVDAIDEFLYSGEGMLIDIIQRGWIQPQEGDKKVASEDGVGSEDTEEALQASKQSYNVWANAQAGLILAAMDLFEDTGKKVRVYAPIRSEAFHAAARRVAQAQLSTCAKVTYTKDRLEAIVRLNMAIDLQLEDTQTITEAFLVKAEREYFNHREEYTAIGNLRRRWVSEMVRFSMERPREMMMIGVPISRKAMADLGSRSPTQILAAMHGSLPAVLNEFLQFMVGEPVMREFEKKVFPFIRANVLSYDELQKIQADTIAANALLVHPICKLYSLGLIGDVMSIRETGDLIQRFMFNSAGSYMAQAPHLPSDSRTFVVHPVLASKLQTINERPDGKVGPAYRKEEPCPIGGDLPWTLAVPFKPVKLTLNAYPMASTVDIDGILVAGKQKPKMKGPRANRVATAHTRPHVLLVAWLYTVARLNDDSVTGPQVQESMKTLQKERQIAPRLSTRRKSSSKGKATSAPVAEAMTAVFDGLGDSNDLVVDIRNFLKQHLGVDDGLRIYIDGAGRTIFSSSVMKPGNVTVVSSALP